MSTNLFDRVALFAGGRALQKYGTPVWRRQTHARRGEDVTLTTSRSGTDAGAIYSARGDVATTIAADTPRCEWWDLDGDGVLERLLLMAGAAEQNIGLRAANFSAAAWTAVNLASVNTNQAIAPDGTTQADEIVENTSAADHGVRQDVTITAGDIVVFAVYVREHIGNRWIRLRIDDTAGNNGAQVWFDLRNFAKGTESTIGSGTSYSAIMQPAANGLTRCLLVARIDGSATTARCRALMSTADNETSYTGDGASSVLLWGGHISAGATWRLPSAGILSDATALTKNAEGHSVPLYLGHQPDGLTIYTRFYEMGCIKAATGAPRIWQFGATGSSTPQLRVMNNNDQVYRLQLLTPGRGTTGAILAAGPDPGDVVELIATLTAKAEIALYQSINGAAAISQTGSAGPGTDLTTLASTLYLGASDASAGNPGSVGFDAVIAAAGVHTDFNDFRALLL